jgi:hypothetical protein
MSYAPGFIEPVMPMVSPGMHWCPLFDAVSYYGFASGTVSAATTAFYYPIRVPATAVVRRLWWANGSSTTGNIAAAVYASTPDGVPGTKLVETASTAQGTANEVQFVDVTDIVLPPGVYWIALAASSTSSTIVRANVSTVRWDALAQLSQGSITLGALPATATPAANVSGHVYLFGFATTASP